MPADLGVPGVLKVPGTSRRPEALRNREPLLLGCRPALNPRSLRCAALRRRHARRHGHVRAWRHSHALPTRGGGVLSRPRALRRLLRGPGAHGGRRRRRRCQRGGRAQHGPHACLCNGGRAVRLPCRHGQPCGARDGRVPRRPRCCGRYGGHERRANGAAGLAARRAGGHAEHCPSTGLRLCLPTKSRSPLLACSARRPSCCSSTPCARRPRPAGLLCP